MLHVRLGLAVTVCWLCLGGCSRPSGPPAQQATPPPPLRAPAAPVPRAPAAAQPTPRLRASGGQRATPTPAPVLTANPAATPTAAPRTSPVPRLPPDAAPQILSVAMSKNAVAPGDRVTGSVLTSSNVASVEARIGGYALTLNKVGVGRFTFTYTVGPLPWFIHGNYTMQVIARNTRGDAVRRLVPLTVR